MPCMHAYMCAWICFSGRVLVVFLRLHGQHAHQRVDAVTAAAGFTLCRCSRALFCVSLHNVYFLQYVMVGSICVSASLPL